MDTSDEKLVQKLKEGIAKTGYNTAFEADPPAEDENPLETDFFKAINAYRAAKAKGDAQAVAEAEAHLQSTVRSELSGS